MYLSMTYKRNTKVYEQKKKINSNKKNSPGYEGKKGTVAQAPLIVVTHLATCQFTHPVLGKVTARSARPRRQGADH